eukprot:s278_g44.t3
MNLKQLLNLLMELLGWDDPSWCSFINNVCVFGLAQRAVVVLSPQLPSPRRASKVDREGTCQHSRGSFLSKHHARNESRGSGALVKPFQWHLEPDYNGLRQEQIVDLGPQSHSMQHERVLTTCSTLAARLTRFGKVAEGNPGYAADDMFVEEAEEPLVPGMPVVHVDSNEYAAYLGPSDHGLHKICILKNEETIRCPRDKIVPFPVDQGKPGDWVLYVDPHPSQFHFLGRLGMCLQPCAVNDPKSMGVAEHEKELYKVLFPNQLNPAEEGDLTALPRHKLVTLPAKPRDDVGPWEFAISKIAMPAVLPQIGDSAQIEEAGEASDEEIPEVAMESEDELGSGPRASFSTGELEKILHGANSGELLVEMRREVLRSATSRMKRRFRPREMLRRAVKQRRHTASTAHAALAAPNDRSTVPDGSSASPSKGPVVADAAPESSNDAVKVPDIALTSPNEGSMVADAAPASVNDASMVVVVDAAPAAPDVAPASPSKGSVAADAAPESSNDAVKVPDIALTRSIEGSMVADAAPASVNDGSMMVDGIASPNATSTLADVDRFIVTNHFTARE